MDRRDFLEHSVLAAGTGLLASVPLALTTKRSPKNGLDSETTSPSFIGPFFSYPYTAAGKVNDTLMDATVHLRLQDLFEGVTSDTKVRGTVYIWQYEDFGTKQSQMTGPAVSSAKAFTDRIGQLLTNRDAQFIVDVRYMNSATRTAFQTLGLSVHEDSNSAAGGGILHSKFFTFSHLRFPPGQTPSGYPSEMNNVVAVLSANIDNSMFKAANNLLIMHGNQELHDTFVTLWEYIRAHPHAHQSDAVSRLCGDVYVASFPRNTDYVAQILSKVFLQRGRWGDDPPKIRIAMYLFSREAISNLLVFLSLLGADIKVVLTNDSGNADLDKLFGMFGIESRLLPNNAGVMHSKYILVDADYELGDVVKRRKIVWTGSHNYTTPALKENDEIIIRVPDSGVYSAYLSDWHRLWNLAG
jgi:hypothetical protein